MKKTSATKSILLFSFCLLIISVGCKKLDIEKELRIDIGTQFQNEFVTIKLDNNLIFSDRVTTNQIVGVANILKFDYPIGIYKISVTVNGIEKKNKFRHKINRYVYISYDQNTSEISITYPDEYYTYD